VPLDVLYDEYGGQEDAKEREEDGDALGVERSFCHRLGKREERDELRPCDDDVCVLQADECDEKADADGAAALVEALEADWDVEWVAGTERKAGTLTVLIRQ